MYCTDEIENNVIFLNLIEKISKFILMITLTASQPVQFGSGPAAAAAQLHPPTTGGAAVFIPFGSAEDIIIIVAVSEKFPIFSVQICYCPKIPILYRLASFKWTFYATSASLLQTEAAHMDRG